MAPAALALYVLFALLAFGGRAWLQFKRTGDHGLRGFPGPLLSTAGVGRVPALSRRDPCAPRPARRAFRRRPLAPLPVSMRAAGLALMPFGIVLTLIA